jgi:hypothetical protein
MSLAGGLFLTTGAQKEVRRKFQEKQSGLKNHSN